MNVGCVGTDDRDSLYFFGVEGGEELVFVLQQNNGFFGGLLCQFLVLDAVGDFLRIVRVNIRILKHPSRNFAARTRPAA